MTGQDLHAKDEYIELKFGPKWKYISAARAFIQNFLGISIGDQEKADKLAMAASELLENAVKYSVNSETLMKVTVDSAGRMVRVTVSNQAGHEQCGVLDSIFKEIMSKSPLEAYVDRMKAAATREDGKSQLGLVRIRYEVGPEMKLQISADDKVTISLEM